MLALREGQSQELFRELMCPMIKDAFLRSTGNIAQGRQRNSFDNKKTEKDKALKFR